MEKQKLYQYVVIAHQFVVNEKEVKEYKDSVIVIQPSYVLAKSEKEVIFKVTREVPDKFAQDPDNIEIIIRNF